MEQLESMWQSKTSSKMKRNKINRLKLVKLLGSQGVLEHVQPQLDRLFKGNR